MTEWDDLAATYQRIWAELGTSLRHGVLATVGLGGGAEARGVMLRGAKAGKLVFHTDLATPKCAEIAAEPRGSVVFWNGADWQVRIKGRLSVDRGTEAAWAQVPADARLVYGGDPAPGTPLARPADHRPAATPARFAEITLAADEIDSLWLGPSGHRRARFRRAERWQGTWIAP